MPLRGNSSNESTEFNASNSVKVSDRPLPQINRQAVRQTDERNQQCVEQGSAIMTDDFSKDEDLIEPAGGAPSNRYRHGFKTK